MDSEVRRNLASLNDIVASLACGLATGEPVSKGWAYTVVETMEKCQKTLGQEALLTTDQLAGWEGEE